MNVRCHVLERYDWINNVAMLSLSEIVRCRCTYETLGGIDGGQKIPTLRWTRIVRQPEPRLKV